VLALPALARPKAMARRLALAKLLHPRLSADSAGDRLAYDLIEQIGMEVGPRSHRRSPSSHQIHEENR
jgi:hypothetical protein